MDTPAVEPVVTPAVAAPPAPAAAPVPLTAVPAVDGATASTEAAAVPRVKRKYTKRADKAAAPKKEKAVKKTKRAAKAPKEKKAKRIAGTKAQGQVPKPVFRFLKNEAKEANTSVGSLVGEILTAYATRRGLKLDA